MGESSRRKFVKQSALILAGGALVSASSAEAAEQTKASDKVVLYKETEEWKRYYETLE